MYMQPYEARRKIISIIKLFLRAVLDSTLAGFFDSGYLFLNQFYKERRLIVTRRDFTG